MAQSLSFKDVPGPKSEPGLGFLKEFQEAGGHFAIFDVLKTFRKKYGDIIRYDMPGLPAVVLCHPDDIQKVYQNEGKYPVGTTVPIWPVNVWEKQYFGSPQNNVASITGEEWKKLRNILQKDMFSPKDAAEYISLTHKCAREAVEAFPKWIKERHELYYPVVSFDLLQHVFYNSGRGVWERDFDTNPDKDFYVTGIRAFARMFKLCFVPQSQADPKELQDYIDDMSSTLDYLKDLLNKSLQNPETLTNSAVKPFFLKMLERGELQEKEYLSGVAGLLFAALDTTSTTLAWLIYNLARTPEAQEKLYQEVNKVKNGGPLLKEHLSNIPYLKACLKESNRVTPINPYNQRKVPVEINLQGYNFPADTVFYLHTATSYCLDPNVYENPYDFVPDRWIKDKSQRKLENHNLHDHPYMILPFSIGPRMCMGARLAEVEMFSFVSELIQKYKITLAPDSPIPRQVCIGAVRPEPFPKYVVENR